ncbi:Limit dextrin alpha-1,6-maltotetraose-hydrolase, partial [hydrothermal vent metagenome]
DGTNENYSFNYGTEGPAAEVIERIRIRQIKNMLATLLISRGVPMLLGGDELRRTKKGNNNSYCQDNEISWYDWRLLRKNQEIYRFAGEMIAFRKEHKVLSREKFYTDRDILWFSPDGGNPDWGYSGRSFGCIILADKEEYICLLFNADFVEKRFVVPPAPGTREWHVTVDTSRETPDDIHEPGKEAVTVKEGYILPERSLAILVLHKE